MVELARCPHCGALALEDAAFCVECGKRVLPGALVAPRVSPAGPTTGALGTPVSSVPQPASAMGPLSATALQHPPATDKLQHPPPTLPPDVEVVPAIPAEVSAPPSRSATPAKPAKKVRSAITSSIIPSIDEVDRSFDTILSGAEPTPDLTPRAPESGDAERIILESLLRQVPGVGTVAIDRILRSGLTAIEAIAESLPERFAEAAGVSRDLAERVVARVQRYRSEQGALAPGAGEEKAHQALESLAQRLEEQNAAFEKAQQTFKQSETGRRVRRERNATLLEINLLLARFGQTLLVEKLARLPFRSKAEELRRFLSAPKN